MRNRDDPKFSESITADPHLPLSSLHRTEYIEDMNRSQSRLLAPLFRCLVIVGVWLVRTVKRYLPLRIASHSLMNRLGVWFLRNCISPNALACLIRHLQIESSLINFVAVNCGSSDVKQVDLMPVRVSQLGDWQGMNAIVRHDINIINHVIDTGTAGPINITHAIPLAEIDFSMLALPTIEHEPERKRWLNLDIESASYIMVFFLVLFLSDKEGERAAQSLQLDDSLMTSISNLTGDDFYRYLFPFKFTHQSRYHFDVVKDLRDHMLGLEYAYAHLLQLRSKQNSI